MYDALNEIGKRERASKRRRGKSSARTGVYSSPRSGEVVEWRRRAIIGIQALALVVLQITGILCITSLRAAADPIIVRPRVPISGIGPSAATDALLPEPQRSKIRPMKRQALGRGLDALLGEVTLP